jgi:hypothetical protein
MKSKSNLATIMQQGGDLERFNERMKEAVRIEMNNGDYLACYLSIVMHTAKDTDGRVHRVLCALGNEKAILETICQLLKDYPTLIPIFEEAVSLSKSRINVND